eukprot:7016470-Karenia_brevis.AAC.1
MFAACDAQVYGMVKSFDKERTALIQALEKTKMCIAVESDARKELEAENATLKLQQKALLEQRLRDPTQPSDEIGIRKDLENVASHPRLKVGMVATCTPYKIKNKTACKGKFKILRPVW